MATHIRKLLPPDGNSTQTLINTSSSSFSSSSSLKIEERENLNPTFDSAMALTVLALLIALLFFSFLSIYARQFSADSSPRRRRRSSSPAYFSTTASYKAKGVDPTTIESLPVHAHGGGGGKQGIKPDPDMEIMECAICLGEFEEREWVKEIPYCGHVFHVECIDTWLSSHVTCPLCRTANLFPPAPVEEEGSGVGEVQGDEVRLVVDECDTWQGGEREREVGPLGHVRRSSSCSSRFDERMTLHRSLSF